MKSERREVKSFSPEVPLVTVIIPCRNEAAHIEACLSSVLAQEKPQGGFEIIVADGMSEDGTREILARLQEQVGGQSSVVGGPVIRVIDNPGRIVSTGLNMAIGAAHGEIVIRMDAHTEYARDYVRRCVELIQSTGADNVGGPAGTRPTTYLEHAVAAAYHSPFSAGGARFHDVDHEGQVDTVPYGCWRRVSFDRFGHFDEELVRNQDDEHNLRIVRGGGKIWQSPKIKSWYHPRGSLAALFQQYMQYGYWKVRVIQKHKLPASPRHLVPGAFLLTLFVLLVTSGLGLLASGHGPLPSGLRPLASVLWPLAFWLLTALTALYALCVLGASVLTSVRTEWKLLPVLPLVFACYHFGYGWGFLRGISDFMVLRRSAGKSFSRITREEELELT